MAIYFALVVLGTLFRESVAVNPEELAGNLARTGGFIPGIAPGWQTVAYVGYVHSRIVTAGSLCLGVLAVVPVLGFALLNAAPRFPFGGAVALLVVLFLVDVSLDTWRRIESERARRGYESLLR
jgi:preprotein translocase subunit SecY